MNSNLLSRERARILLSTVAAVAAVASPLGISNIYIFVAVFVGTARIETANC